MEKLASSSSRSHTRRVFLKLSKSKYNWLSNKLFK